MGKKRYVEISFDKDNNPLIQFLPDEKYSVTDLNDILCLMSLRAYENLRNGKKTISKKEGEK